jgi:hypothetical protein
MEIVEIGKLQSLQEVATKTRRSRLENLHGCLGETVADQRPQLGDVNRQIVRVDADIYPISDDSRLVVVVDEAAQLRQAPTQ